MGKEEREQVNPIFMAAALSVARHVVSGIGGALMGLGLEQAVVSNFTAASVPIVAGVIVYVIPQAFSLWIIIKKRFFPGANG